MTELQVGDIVTHAIFGGAGIVTSMAHEWPDVEVYWDGGIIEIESVEFLEMVIDE